MLSKLHAKVGMLIQLQYILVATTNTLNAFCVFIMLCLMLEMYYMLSLLIEISPACKLV